MPFIVCRVSTPVSHEQEIELKKRLGKAIAHMPGKSEAGLMLSFEGEARLWLAGGDAPCVFVEAAVFANEEHAGYDAFAVDVAEAFTSVLGIPPNACTCASRTYLSGALATCSLTAVCSHRGRHGQDCNYAVQHSHDGALMGMRICVAANRCTLRRYHGT